jgi:ribosomal protein S12 methylthiotransferase accessory factor
VLSLSVDTEGQRLDRPSPSERALSDFCDAIVSGLHISLSKQPSAEEVKQCFHAILPLCHRARITRLGDLTGLDRLGLPVVQAVRPDALSEVSSLGRGLSTMEAAIGAIMESLERFYAESISSDRVFLATANDLNIADGLFDNLLLPNRQGNWRKRTIPWITGVNVATGSTQPVPLELVHTCYTDPPPAYDGVFLRSTTGLACHTTSYGAFLHGMFECVERDAIARAFATHGFFDRMRIAPTGLGDRVDHILSLAGERWISVALWLAPSPGKVPVVWCQTIETGPGEPMLALPTEGYSAGPNIETAVSSALLEALAARAGAISGTRDDQTRKHYRKSTDTIVSKARQLILEEASSMRSAEAESLAVPNLGTLIDRIVSAGLGPVLAVHAGSDTETGVQCVRTILPGALPFSIVR